MMRATLALTACAAVLAGCGSTGQVWTGDEVRATAVPGSSHCDMQSLTFIDWAGHTYVRDPGMFVPPEFLAGDFSDSAALPADASDTGLRHGAQEAWLAADADSLYIVGAETTEHWPRVLRGYGCD